MILFKNIRYKNFLSSGNSFTEIPLNQTNNTLIVGQNGAGKSSVLDALCFSLFNKPFRKINKNQLINSINEKDCVTEVEFVLNGVEYKVIRGMKPNIFEIYLNGNKLNEDASAVDQQKMLEQNILKLNYKSFTQIVILGSASFVPFMQLPSAHRREVIEDLLDIKIFSAMSEIIKSKSKEFRERIKTLEIKKEGAADKILMQSNFIRDLEEKGQQQIKNKENKIQELVTEVDTWQSDVENLLKLSEQKLSDVEQFSTASDAIKKLGNYKATMLNRKNTFEEENKFFEENAQCPTCTQHIEEDFRLKKVNEIKESVQKISDGIFEIEEAISKEEERENNFISLEKEINKIQNNISQNNIRISNANKQQKELQNEIEEILHNLENRNSETIKLKEYKEKLRDILSELDEIKDNGDYYSQLGYLLKDDGVKSNIIRKYLPLINQQVNKYLELMDFYINFSLDEEFNEKIQTPIHESFSYPSFSEGEKMRIDLALLFTWREIAKMKNSVVTNLLIMDEVFDSSLDGLGTDEFMKIIKFIVKDANIFIISHKNELHDKFEKVLEFEKVKGFSKLKA